MPVVTILFTVLSLVLGEYLHAAERLPLWMVVSADMGNVVRGPVTNVARQVLNHLAVALSRLAR